jgi:hypothetical protein
MTLIGWGGIAMSSGSSGRNAAAFVRLFVGFLLAGAAKAETIQEPYTLTSSNGVLNLLVVAQAQTVPTLSPLNPTGLVYSVCLRPAESESCPPPPKNVIPYAGPLLKLRQSDVLNIHLVNQLPPLTDSFHATNSEEPQDKFLAMNPTNIHTHGMLVSAHYPTKAEPNYGDNVYVYTFNSANGAPPALAAAHADVRIHSTDYSITIPKNHPSGLFWIHSHIHGISLNQISSGLSGTITVGDVGDYVCNHDACLSFFATLPIRDMVIKDLQVLADGTRQDEQDSAMCLSPTRRRHSPAAERLLRGAGFFRFRRSELRGRKMVRHNQRAAIPDRAHDLARRQGLASGERVRQRDAQFVDPQPRNQHKHGVSDSVRRRGHARSGRYGRIHEPISLRSLPRSGPAPVVRFAPAVRRSDPHDAEFARRDLGRIS